MLSVRELDENFYQQAKKTVLSRKLSFFIFLQLYFNHMFTIGGLVFSHQSSLRERGGREREREKDRE
jgi:hypothetical protein